MTRQGPIIPERNVRDFANDLACEIARQRLAEIADIELQCRHAGARYDAASRSAVFHYLDRVCRVTWPAGEVSYDGTDAEPGIKDVILILDYFTRAGGAPLTGDKITYKELHDGLNYFSVFSTRTTRPLVQFFGDEPETLVTTAALMGGTQADYGDAAVTFSAFPMVPLTYVLWKGDEEFPPEGSILFDSTVSEYLTNDDIHALCETIVWRLVRLKKTGGDNPG